MNNRIAIAAVFALFLIGPACAPQEADKPAIPAEQAMSELVVRWDDALRAGEVEGAVALYVSDNPVTMPPDMPAQSGPEGLATFFAGLFENGGLEVTNREFGVLSGGDIVAARGAYTLTTTDEGGDSLDETGKWICIARRNEDGSLAAVRNIWNRDAPPPGAAPPPGFEGTAGPAAAEDAACLESPGEVDDAFASNWIEGNVAVLVANHSERGSRMAPGLPEINGRDRIGAYLQAYADLFPERRLELMDGGEEIAGDLAYTWGRYSIAYTPADGSAAVEDEGKYVAVSQKGEDGCWRHEWVLWNRDTPWP
jgi:ketosteroid isomerase-like protein